MPNRGIWFIDDNGAESIMLGESSQTFSTGPAITAKRPRGCAVYLGNDRVAIIGGGLNSAGIVEVTVFRNAFCTPKAKFALAL